MSVIFKCIYGPELYRIYRLGTRVTSKVSKLFVLFLRDTIKIFILKIRGKCTWEMRWNGTLRPS